MTHPRHVKGRWLRSPPRGPHNTAAHFYPGDGDRAACGRDRQPITRGGSFTIKCHKCWDKLRGHNG